MDLSLMILERMGKGEFSSSGYILEVKEKKTNKKKRNKKMSFKGVCN